MAQPYSHEEHGEHSHHDHWDEFVSTANTLLMITWWVMSLLVIGAGLYVLDDLLR